MKYFEAKPNKPVQNQVEKMGEGKNFVKKQGSSSPDDSTLCGPLSRVQTKMMPCISVLHHQRLGEENLD